MDGFSETDGYQAVGGKAADATKIVLTPFCLVSPESPYSVWLRTAPSVRGEQSLFAGATETVSRAGNVVRSFADGVPSTYCNTYTGSSAQLDWYALQVPAPVTVGRVLFRHGRVFPDGGWFDASAGGKPQIQILRAPGGAWETVAHMDSYPETTATDSGGLRNGQPFEVRFAPVAVVGIRIVGKPSCGDRPEQSFSSCAELAGFGS